MSLVPVTIASAEGITTRCKGQLGRDSYQLNIFADSEMDGGYRLIIDEAGPYPVKSIWLGKTRVTKQNGRTFDVELSRIAYESGGIPLFDSMSIDPNLVHIDFADINRIRATYQGVNLICQ